MLENTLRFMTTGRSVPMQQNASETCLQFFASAKGHGYTPTGADLDAVIETVKKCPSGALSYSIDEEENRDQSNRQPMVTVSKDGPYYVTGGIELAGVENWAQGASKEHFALCRCGASNNKPFCDGTHLSVKFKDEKN